MIAGTAAAFATALMLLTGSASAQTCPTRTLVMVGSAAVEAVPDIAFVTVGVTNEGETAAATLSANSEALNKVIQAIRAEGIESRDIQTSGLSLRPRYYNPQKPSETDQPRIIGYTAANGVTMRVRGLAKLGGLLDRITKAGANQIRGITFDVADRERLLDDARKGAVADARQKAELYAKAAGIALGKLISLSEESAPAPRLLQAKGEGAAAVPIEAGQVTLTVNVRMVWSLD